MVDDLRDMRVDVREKFNQAMAARQKEDFRTCIDLLSEVLLEEPDFAHAWNERGAALLKCGHPFDAIIAHDRAFAINPMYEAINNRGVAFMELERWKQGVKDFELVAEKLPNLPEPWNNIGNSYMRMGRIKEAPAMYEEALKRKSDYSEARLGLALALLKNGRYKEGWDEYEVRWKSEQLVPRGLPFPLWDRQPAKNSSDIIIVYSEQGMGDALHFARYVKLIKEQWGGLVHLEVRHPLARILGTLKDVDKIITLGDALPKATCCMPLMSAPLLLNRFEPYWGGKYLTADPHRIESFKKQLEDLMPYKYYVGMCWSGMSRTENSAAVAIDKRRSTTLAQFGTLAVPGISWISLQMGTPKEEIKFGAPPKMVIGDFTNDIYDFYDTAAMIECLDLVITVDTSVAHLAGVLNKPTWMFSRYDGCWRWLHNHDATEWYPSMRIFNQTKPGDWDTPFQAAKIALSKRMLNVQHKPKLVVNNP